MTQPEERPFMISTRWVPDLLLLLWGPQQCSLVLSTDNVLFTPLQHKLQFVLLYPGYGYRRPKHHLLGFSYLSVAAAFSVHQ